MKKKIIIGAIVLAGLGGGGYAYYEYNRPAEKTITAKEDFSVDSKTLFTEFETDEAAANSKYLNKVVAVKGTVLDKKLDSTGINLTLESGNDMFGVSCQVPDIANADNLKPGDQVTVKGLCTGMLMDVVLVKCSVVNN